jgi:hypothetical protein
MKIELVGVENAGGLELRVNARGDVQVKIRRDVSNLEEDEEVSPGAASVIPPPPVAA